MKTKNKKGLRVSIFIKILIISIFFATLPTILTFYLVFNTQQNAIEQGIVQKYLPRGDIGIESELLILQKSLLEKTASLLILIIIAVILVSILIAKSLTSPIRELLRKMEELSKGNFKVKVKKISEDEIGELMDNFNKTVEQLRNLHERLRKTNEILEIKVKARTKELEQLNKTLEEKVKLRTQSLQKKIEELERFQKLTVNRETEITKLKAKIKELEEKLNNRNDKANNL